MNQSHKTVNQGNQPTLKVKLLHQKEAKTCFYETKLQVHIIAIKNGSLKIPL